MSNSTPDPHNPSSTQEAILPIPESKIFDVRSIYSNRHQRIFERFAALEVGDFFVLRNSHEPIPLRSQFESLLPGCFSWEKLEPGPGYCQVKITKLREGVGPESVKECGCQ